MKSTFKGSTLMDLLKAFDTINHDLIAILEGYRLSDTTLMYARRYINNRKQLNVS